MNNQSWEARFARFMLDATFTGERLGRGAYGIVEKVIVDGQVCAGKSIHEELILGTDGYNAVLDKYYAECEIMSLFDHPNITKFWGVCAKPECRQPVLVMAKLDGNLNDLLEGYKEPTLPLSLKLSVLEDVAKGLHYLHNFNKESSIIHRDLTTRNVLLTSCIVAKITDFGVSRIIDKRAVQTMSVVPGTIDYMPPEAIEPVPARYGPSLDVFSFGHLALVTLTQNTVANLLSHNHLQDGKRIARSEVERRTRFFEELEAAPGNTQCNHQLKDLVVECLDNDYRRRPSSEHVMNRLELLKKSNKVDIPNSGDITRAASILKEAERNRIKKSGSAYSIYLMKISYLSALAVFGTLLVLMANSGFLTQIILQYPFFLFILSGIILYGIAFLFDFIFLGRSRLYYNKSYFLAFMAVWSAIMGIIFMSLIPPLKLNTERIIFRPTNNCNMFENPTKYICSIMGKKFYTTVIKGCDGTVTNATLFYIISTWIPAKGQYRLKNRVIFHPENITNGEFEHKESYPLPKGYCIQEYKDEDSPSSDDRLRVAFSSWTKAMVNVGDTGYIDKSDLEEYNTGWYKVSNCMWEITRLLPLEDYCITGYVSSMYVTLPDNVARILHDNEHKQ